MTVIEGSATVVRIESSRQTGQRHTSHGEGLIQAGDKNSEQKTQKPPVKGGVYQQAPKTHTNEPKHPNSHAKSVDGRGGIIEA